jgi:catechol 2,3-dioxygenase-like lactoylglutathione lyase family enzyme
MKPRITVITLGVDDLKRAVAFYRDGLGLPTQGIVGTEYPHGAVAFFLLQGGLRLALYPRDDLALDARVAVTPPSTTDFALAHNVATREEVDEVLRQAERAGAVIVKPGQHAFWGGYTGYFRDPDQHLWEVAWNPAWKVED